MPNISLTIQELKAIKKLRQNFPNDQVVIGNVWYYKSLLEKKLIKIKEFNSEMKWKWKNIIYDFNFINSFPWRIHKFVYRQRDLAEAETWRSNCTDSDNLRIKKKWEKIYEFNINQFILRMKNILYGEDEYYSDYFEEDLSYPIVCLNCGKGGPGDIARRCEKRRNPYFDDNNWRQREHDIEESFRLAGD